MRGRFRKVLAATFLLSVASLSAASSADSQPPHAYPAISRSPVTLPQIDNAELILIARVVGDSKFLTIPGREATFYGGYFPIEIERVPRGSPPPKRSILLQYFLYRGGPCSDRVLTMLPKPGDRILVLTGQSKGRSVEGVRVDVTTPIPQSFEKGSIWIDDGSKAFRTMVDWVIATAKGRNTRSERHRLRMLRMAKEPPLSEEMKAMIAIPE